MKQGILSLLTLIFLFAIAKSNLTISHRNLPNSHATLNKIVKDSLYNAPPDTSQIGIAISDSLNKNTPECLALNVLRSGNGKRLVFQKGKVWQEWLRIFKTFMQSDILEKSKVLYCTLGNDWAIGDILVNEPSWGTILEIDSASLSSTDSSRLFKFGGLVASPLSRKTVVSGSFMSSAELYSSQIDADLSLAITSSQSVIVEKLDWRIKSINLGYLYHIMDKTTDDYRRLYSLYAQDSSYYIAWKAVQVDSFHATINIKTDANGSLRTKFNKDSLVLTSLGSGSGNVKIKYRNNKQLSITISSPFLVFIEPIRGKKQLALKN